PDDDLVGQLFFQRLPGCIALASIEDVVDELVAIIVLCAPGEGEEAFLIHAAADVRSAGASRRRVVAAGNIAIEARDLWIARRERPLEDSARWIDRDRQHFGTNVARQVCGGYRGQQRSISLAAGQHRAPLQISRTRARDRATFLSGVRRRPV